MSAGLDGVSDGVPVTVLFCDIAGLPGLAGVCGSGWPEVLRIYQALVRGAVEGCGGHVEESDGAVVFGSFLDASAAVRAAGLIERELGEVSWPVDGLKVEARVGLHAGVVGDGLFLMKEGGETRLIGLDVHRGARVMAAANAGQVLVTDAVRGSLAGGGADGLEDLGFHRLRDFPESVRLFHLVVDENHPASVFPPPKTLDFRPTNLTADVRPLLGRDELIASVRSAFLDDRRRLVTLTGPGGVGKTRVGIAVGSELLEEHRGGVWLVRAETLKRREQLLPAIARVVGVRDLPGQDLFDVLVDRLQSVPMLLVLDNLEQLAGVASMVSELVDRTVSLRVLVTSQTPLRIESETVLPVVVLKPGDAVELFDLSARSAGASLNLDDPQVKRDVVELIERLDYLPLAIELAAAQLRSLTLTELSLGLRSQLELQVAQADKPERQQSLHAIIDWSVAALPPDARQLFTRFGVFSGITTLELIEEVCGQGINVLEAAATLIDFSLLRRADIGFGMPPAIQQTASNQLTHSPEEQSLRRLHAEAMSKQAAKLADLNNIGPSTDREGSALDSNFNTAVSWARKADQEIYLDLITNLSGWWGLTGRVKISIRELTAALALDGISDLRRAQLLRFRGLILVKSAHTRDAAEVDIQEGLRLVGDSPSAERGSLLAVQSLIEMFFGNSLAAANCAAGAAALFRQLSQPDRLLHALCLQAQALIAADDINLAGEVLSEATELAQDRTTIYAATGLPNIKGDWALATNQPLQALAFYASALANEWSRFLFLYHTAGVIVSLARLEQFASVVELSTALQGASKELGYVFERLHSSQEWPDQLLDTASRALTPVELSEAQARGQALSAGQLATRALTISNAVLETNGVTTIRPTSRFSLT